MNLSINGQSQVPPGFRFHPTEEELLHYYLRKKLALEKIDLDVIQEVDLNKLEPWDIQEKCRIGSTPQNDWYFFSHKDKKYPTGTRTNRATAAGFWKATGRDKIIYSSFKRIGLRKTLVFYKGRAPHGQKSDWIMHEYRLDETNLEPTTGSGEMMSEEGWVVCRVFKKKNYQKTLDSPRSLSTSMGNKLQMLCNDDNGVLDQILTYMGQQRTNSCKIETDHVPNNTILDEDEDNDDINFPHEKKSKNSNSRSTTTIQSCYNSPMQHDKSLFMHLPRLDSPTIPNLVVPPYDHYQPLDDIPIGTVVSSNQKAPNNWVAMDRLVASQLNGQAESSEPSKQFGCFEAALNNDNDELEFSQIRFGRGNNQSLANVFSSDSDLWCNFTANSASSPSSDPLRHLSV